MATEAQLQRGPGGIIEEKGNAMNKAAGRSLWRGMQSIGASGFGKGLLITGVIVLGAVALFSGWLAAGGALKVGGLAVPTFEAGFGIGMSKAFSFLTSGLGLATLAIGGLVGAFADIRANQNQLAAMEAERLSLQYQNARNQQPQPQLAPQAPQPEPQQPAAPQMPPAAAAPPPAKGYALSSAILKEKGFEAYEMQRELKRRNPESMERC